MAEESHDSNLGLLILPNGQYKQQKLCWCQIHHVWKTDDVITEEVADLVIYRPCAIPTNTPINQTATHLLKRQIRGPIYIRSPEHDLSAADLTAMR